MTAGFPEAVVLLVAGRLRPGLDGGFTIATMRRATDLAAAGVRPVLVTTDPGADAERDLAHFRALGLADAGTRLIALREWYRARGEEVELPMVTGRADWHLAEEPVVLRSTRGMRELAGFGALYREFIAGVVAAECAVSGRAEAVVICESKQVGTLLARDRAREYALVHTVHSAHTSEPFEPDSPVDALWAPWFAELDGFDAVLWPTLAQRRDAAARYGEREGWAVVPHPAVVPEQLLAVPRDPWRVLVIARLSMYKRVDHALRAFARLPKRARLTICGDGPERARLEELARELGVADRVEFAGARPDAADLLAGAAVLLLTSQSEGQSLVVVEALSRGCPVVAYDIRYGPGEMVEDGVSGLLVPYGDISGLADALGGLLGRPERIAAMSKAALAWARAHGPELSMSATAAAVRGALARRFPRVS